MNFFVLLIFWFPPVANQADNGWEVHTIDASSSGADGVKLADINQDGLLDITTGWEEGGLTKLYLHPGVDKVKELWPNVIVGTTPNVEDAVFADMNDDGRLDIVSCTENNSEKIFIHFSPESNLLDEKEWHQEVLPTSDRRMKWMYAEPFQLDYKNGKDLIAAGKGENAQIGWFEAPEIASNLNGWQWHPISPMGWVMSIILRDMNGDGHMDIVVSDRRGKLRACRWLENPGPGEKQKKSWESHVIGGQDVEVMFMTMRDIDLDGKEEAVVTDYENHNVSIFKRQNPEGTKWSKQVFELMDDIGTGKSVEVGDINLDGQPDLVLSTNTHKKDLIGLSWIDGKSLTNTNKLKLEPISKRGDYKYDRVELHDMDQDGDLDVLICEENNGEGSRGLGVVWYENPIK